MRVYRFRVWDTQEKIFWNTENGWYFFRGLPEYAVAIGAFFGDSRFIVNQSTSFLDKNGKDIYEGDICFADGQRRVIIFEDGMFGYATTLGMHCVLIPSLMEVIGNIFEQEWMLEAYNLKIK